MKKFEHILLLSLLIFAACGRPPSGQGGPPRGDFPVQVVVSPVLKLDLQEKVVLVGTLISPEEISVTARFQGELLELPIAAGQSVEAGVLLARLDDVRLLARKSELTASLTLARNTLERKEQLVATNTATQQEMDEAQADYDQASAALALLEEDLKDARITAPFPGRLGERKVSVGQMLQAGDEIFTLTRMNPLELRFEVPERFSSALHDGMTVRMRSEAYPDEVLEGRVVFLSPNVNPQTRSIVVRAEIPNPDEKLRPGMFGRMELVLANRPGALVVPEAAVMQRGTDTMVLRQNSEGRAEMRTVQVGLRLDGMMEIRSGLEEGDIVVVEGLMKIGPGTLLAFSPDSARYGVPVNTGEAENGGDE